MGIKKLAKVLPKLRDFNKKLSAEKIDLDIRLFKPAKAKNL